WDRADRSGGAWPRMIRSASPGSPTPPPRKFRPARPTASPGASALGVVAFSPRFPFSYLNLLPFWEQARWSHGGITRQHPPAAGGHHADLGRPRLFHARVP